MNKDNFEYNLKIGNIDSLIYITENIDAVSRINSNGTEPSHNYRLWIGSVCLSKYLETVSDLLGSKILELGSGLGLCSIVSAKMSPELVVVTDLNIALPLLSYNCLKNANSGNNMNSISDINRNNMNSKLTSCPSGHLLCQNDVSQLEDLEFSASCNICDIEIDSTDALSDMQSCRSCNFDVCKSCLSVGLDELPEWYRLAIGGNSSFNSEIHMENGCRIIISEFDWNSETDAEKICSILPSFDLVLGADVTYSRQSIASLFIALCRLSHQTGKKKVLLAHHRRSEESFQYLIQVLDASGWVYRELDIVDQVDPDVLIFEIAHLSPRTVFLGKEGDIFGRDLRGKHFWVKHTNLNHGSFGAVPEEVSLRQFNLLKEQESHCDKWFRCSYLQYMQEARQRVADLICCEDKEEVVLVQNSSDACNSIVKSLLSISNQNQTGRTTVLVFSTAYGMVMNLLHYLKNTSSFDVQLIVVQVNFPVIDKQQLLDALEANLTSSVSMCIFSHISSMPTMLEPVEDMCRLARKRCPQAMLIVDGAHAPGNVDIDVNRIGADCYFGNLHVS